MKPSEVLTADSKAMIVDNYVLWRITDPLTFYKTIGTKTEAETRIDMLTYNAIKTEMGKSLRDAIINQDDMSRELFNNNILSAASKATGGYGIENRFYQNEEGQYQYDDPNAPAQPEGGNGQGGDMQ